MILLEKKADIAVHSLKDMTAQCPEGLTIAAVTKREDPRDAFVSNKYKSLDELPPARRWAPPAFAGRPSFSMQDRTL